LIGIFATGIVGCQKSQISESDSSLETRADLGNTDAPEHQASIESQVEFSDRNQDKLTPISKQSEQVEVEPELSRFEIDGDFVDWKSSHKIATDRKGDGAGVFDVTEVMAVVYGDYLYVNFSLDQGSKTTLQNGRDVDGTLQLLVESGDQQLTLDLRARTFHCENQVYAWRDFDFRCLPTYAANRYELRLLLEDWDLANLTIDFRGSDRLDQPAAVTKFVQPAVDGESALDLKKEPQQFRLANLNTLDNGLADGERKQSLHRLLRAANADVYTFQEEWNEQKFRRALPQLKDTLSRELDSVWFGGCAIVSRLPIEPIGMTLDRAAAGLIKIDKDRYVAVISVHLKSAGHAGSREDLLRIQQAEQVVGEIQKMRQGKFGENARDAAVIVVGDYNLVGSRLPLDVFQGPGLSDVLFKDSKTGEAMTWQGETRTTFWPGRLDLLCHDSKLTSTRGMILNSGTLTDEELEGTGLERSDSLASDHLMLIGDFEFEIEQ
jgi:hypothetical protein